MITINKNHNMDYDGEITKAISQLTRLNSNKNKTARQKTNMKAKLNKINNSLIFNLRGSPYTRFGVKSLLNYLKKVKKENKETRAETKRRMTFYLNERKEVSVYLGRYT